ncbi:MAG: DUF3800 domain-containing protein [Solirubrobacterales bacterium]
MYSLYLDGSGTHGGSPVFILAGVAVHEQDTYHLQKRFEAPLKALPAGLDSRDFELHAAEMKNPNAAKGSRWQGIPWPIRRRILQGGYRALESYQCIDNSNPPAFIGAVVERSYRDYEERAWEQVLHKFDEMLARQGKLMGEHQRGIVIHDRSSTEKRVQSWADKWRQLSSRIGTLTHMTDVPFFSDSRASRLLQSADFVAWALWRYYGVRARDEQWIKPLWGQFDTLGDGKFHSLIHVSRAYRLGQCACPPCTARPAKSKTVQAAGRAAS